MTPLFADTSFYIAFVSERDAYHERAVLATQQHRRRQVTTEYVLVETGNWLAKSDRLAFMQLLSDLHADPNTAIVAASPELFHRACRLYGNGWTRNGRS